MRRAPSAARSDSVRRPIGFRPPPDQIPSAVRSDSVRHTIGLRPPSDWIPFAVLYKMLSLYSRGGLLPPQQSMMQTLLLVIAVR